MEKVVNQVKLAILSHSEPLQWEKIGKVVNRVKLAIPSHSEPLWWEKIGKVVNQVKLAIPSHSEPLWWEKIGKVANQAKLAILSHYELLWWEQIGKVATQTKSNFSRGGVHHPEPQCHVDPKSQLNLKNRCFLFSVFHKLEMNVCNESGGVDWSNVLADPSCFFIAFMFISILLWVGVVTSARTKMSP